MNREGSASALVLSLLLFLSALFLGAVAFVELAAHGLRRSQLQDEEVRILRRAAEDTLEALLDDPTPFADAPSDPVWSRMSQAAGGEVAVTLEDVSSRLGPNWIRRELLQDLGVLKPGRTVGELEQIREEQGPALRLQPAYSPFIKEEELEQMFTPYGYFNINLTDERVLCRLLVERGADLPAAESLRIMVQQARAQMRVIDPEDLPEFLGEQNCRLLFPVVNAEAAMNVHFVPERVLEALFHHCEQPRGNLSRLLEARQAAELTQGQLQRLLAGRTDQRSPLEPYLGLKTWFWRITVEGRRQRLVWIAARVPRADGVQEFRRVEERLEP
jgi:hypothetical protein